MKCPACRLESREVELTERTVSEGLIINHCPTCNGVWLEQAELKQFVREIEDYIKDVSLREMARQKSRLLTDDSPTKLCPTCSSAMQKFNYAYDSNIFFDRCLKCHGIWADGGEIIAVARYSKT